MGVYGGWTATPGSLLIHDRQSVFVVDPTGEPVAPAEIYGDLVDHVILSVRLASDTSLVVEITDEVELGDPPSGHNIQQHWSDGSGLRLIDDAVLFDVAVFGGVESALVGEAWDGTAFEEGQLLAVPLDGRPPIAFGTAFAPEYGVGSIDVVDGVAVVSAFADLTELVSYTDIEGNEITLPSPTDDLPYGEAPFVHLATFSPDGSELAWIEGPEHYLDVEAGTESWHGEWRIRSLDISTGDERLSWPFGFPNEDPFAQVVTGFVHAGDRLYVSRAQVHDGLLFDIEMLMLDLATEEPELVELPVFGVVADVVA